MSDKRVVGSNPRGARVAVLTAAALAGVIFFGGFVGPQKTLASRRHNLRRQTLHVELQLKAILTTPCHLLGAH
jgi:hypothetical protein